MYYRKSIILIFNPNNKLIRIKFRLSTQICFAMINFSRYLRPMNSFEREMVFEGGQPL